MTKKQKCLKQLQKNKSNKINRYSSKKCLVVLNEGKQNKWYNGIGVAHYCCPPIRRFFICTENQHVISGLYKEGDKCPTPGCNGILKMYNGRIHRKKHKRLRR